MLVLQNLVRHSVDYAGLFPPAGLPMDQVVANYAAYLQQATSPMLGRLVIPAGRLAEFEECAVPRIPADAAELPWRISALVPAVEGFDADIFVGACQSISEFNQLQQTNSFARFIVDSLEIKTTSPDNISDTMDRLPDGFQSYLEIDCNSDPTESILRIASHRHNTNVFAKIRTGSVVPEQIPSVENVARFIRICAENSVGMKATAGLHHPLRGDYRLTYEDDAPQATLLGFLNVFVAAMIAFEHRVDDQVLGEILNETSLDRFQMSDSHLAWQGLRVSSNRIAELRQTGIASFGSCSFDEPTEELQSLGFHGLFPFSPDVETSSQET
jgi:hypothetical protein